MGRVPVGTPAPPIARLPHCESPSHVERSCASDVAHAEAGQGVDEALIRACAAPTCRPRRALDPELVGRDGVSVWPSVIAAHRCPPGRGTRPRARPELPSSVTPHRTTPGHSLDDAAVTARRDQRLIARRSRRRRRTAPRRRRSPCDLDAHMCCRTARELAVVRPPGLEVVQPSAVVRRESLEAIAAAASSCRRALTVKARRRTRVLGLASSCWAAMGRLRDLVQAMAMATPPFGSARERRCPSQWVDRVRCAARRFRGADASFRRRSSTTTSLPLAVWRGAGTPGPRLRHHSSVADSPPPASS